MPVGTYTQKAVPNTIGNHCACMKQKTPGGNIKEVEPDIDELIAYPLKPPSWYMNSFENLHDDLSEENEELALSHLLSKRKLFCQMLIVRGLQELSWATSEIKDRI